MHEILIETAEHQYPVYIGSHLLGHQDNFIKHLTGQQVLIVTDDIVAPLYLAPLVSLLKDYSVDTLILPSGEKHKSIQSWLGILDTLATQGHLRSTTLMALGGGVIGDMVGFAASCYMRGVNFIQIPTTLLAQVDASIGGKTGVNHALGKNMIGTFYQPAAVLIDVSVLNTLPEREFRSGLAEVVKYALIADLCLFEKIEREVDRIMQRQPELLTELIAQCCQIKANIVRLDEREKGIRAILNFGHTIAHALEVKLGYGHWLHGEAVAVGMVIEAEISHQQGMLTASEVKRIQALLSALHLPVTLPVQVRLKDLTDNIAWDKKRRNKDPVFILLETLGQALSGTEIALKNLRMFT